jgi:ATP phosphoribosyltransferase
MVSGTRLRLAIPNKGRLLEPTMRLLEDAGLALESGPRLLVARAEGVPLDVLAVRTEDIVELVADGAADLGITGLDLLTEARDGRAGDLIALLELGYGRCRLEAAVPSDAEPVDLADLTGCRLATSHPATTRRFFADLDVPVEVVPMSGAVEVAPRLGLADGIVDLVATGSTLTANGLRPIGTLLDSQAVLVGRVDDAEPTGDGLVGDLRTMLGAVVAGRRRKYLMMNAPRAALPAIEALLPGLDSPSVIPLAHPGHVAVHAVVAADQVWSILPRLREAGASGILVMALEKLLP